MDCAGIVVSESRDCFISGSLLYTESFSLDSMVRYVQLPLLYAMDIEGGDMSVPFWEQVQK